MAALRAFLPLLSAAALLTALPAAAIDPFRENVGPYGGSVREGETDLHLYATGPRWCLVAPRYFVTLEYAPASDVLALQAAGQSAVGADGRAEVAFDADCSTQFLVTVTGVAVASAADYTVTVRTGLRDGA